MADFHFEARFGDLPLLIASWGADDGQDIAVQSPSRGDRHFLQNRGAKLGRVSCEILFIRQPGLAPAIERFRAFVALVARAEPQIFNDPLRGVSYRARAEGGRYTARADDSRIVYDCAFLPEDGPQAVVQVGAGVAPVAGVETVTVAAAAADRQLAAVGLQSPVPSDARAFINRVTTSAEEADADIQGVLVETATITQRINRAIDTLDLATDITRWQAYASMINLAAAVMRAGEALRRDQPKNIAMRTDKALPLIVICKQVYGAEEAEDQARTVAKMNRDQLRTPNRVPAGMTLRMPAPRQQR